MTKQAENASMYPIHIKHTKVKQGLIKLCVNVGYVYFISDP